MPHNTQMLPNAEGILRVDDTQVDRSEKIIISMQCSTVIDVGIGDACRLSLSHEYYSLVRTATE